MPEVESGCLRVVLRALHTLIGNNEYAEQRLRRQQRKARAAIWELYAQIESHQRLLARIDQRLELVQVDLDLLRREALVVEGVLGEPAAEVVGPGSPYLR